MALTPSSSRFVTTHDTHGSSVFLYEGDMPVFSSTSSTGATLLHGVPWSDSTPPSLSDDSDTQTTAHTHLHTGSGSTARFAVIPPHCKGLLHRTATLDYVVIQKGQIYLELDDGSERLCREGDVVVQRGTRHAWHNRFDQPCQFFAVLVTAPLPEISGKQLHADRT